MLRRQAPRSELLPGPICSATSILLVFVNEAVDEWDERFACTGKGECTGGCIPIKLEACGERGDPNLAYRSVGCYDELAGWLLENNVQSAALLFDLKAGFLFFFAGNQVFFERIQRAFRR